MSVVPSCLTPSRWKRPSVSVPVLSKNQSFDRANANKCVGFRRRIPNRRRRLIVTVQAVGMASDSAHGQVTTRTDSAYSNACSGFVGHQKTKVMIDSVRTEAVNQRIKG